MAPDRVSVNAHRTERLVLAGHRLGPCTASGRRVLQQSAPHWGQLADLSLPLPQLPTGVYLLQVSANEGHISLRVAVQ